MRDAVSLCVKTMQVRITPMLGALNGVTEVDNVTTLWSLRTSNRGVGEITARRRA